MFRYALISSAVLLSFGAKTEPYSSTLSVEEQERHEFIDTQQGDFPSGKISSGTTSSAVRTGPGLGVTGTTFVPSPSPWLNDRPVLDTTR